MPDRRGHLREARGPAPVTHARRYEGDPAICGAAPGSGAWTTRRSEVTCIACRVEISERLKLRRLRGER